MNCGPDLLREEEEKLVSIPIKKGCFGNPDWPTDGIPNGVEAIDSFRLYRAIPIRAIEIVVGVEFLVPLVVVHTAMKITRSRLGNGIDRRTGASTVFGLVVVG